MHRTLALACLLLPSVLSAQIIQVDAQDPRAPLAGIFDKEPMPYGTVVAFGSAIGDLDGDGYGDLVVSSAMASNATLGGFLYYRGRGDGTFEDVTRTRVVGGSPNIGPMVLADIDGDGDLDVCSTMQALRNRNGVLTPEALPTLSITRTCIAAGDIDGDGDIDLFFGVGFGGGTPQQDRLLLNNGSGVFTFAPVAWLPVDNDTTLAATFVDADGDGDRDLVLGIERQGPTGGGGRLYLNNGSGTFTDASANLGAPGDNVLSVVAGDFDGDGDQDVVFGTSADLYGVEQLDRFFRNQGNGHFALDAVALPSVLASTRHMIATDLDHDGDLDLLLAEGVSRDRRQRVYRNDGTIFTDVSASWLPAELALGAFWAVGAVDANPDPDAVLVLGSSSTSGRLRVFLNRGGTTFLDLTPARLPPSLRVMEPSARFADIDLDGDLDVFLPNGSVWSTAGVSQWLLRNDGDGVFTDVSATHLPAMLYSVTAAEFVDTDRDGDLDLVLGTNAGVVLWVNDSIGHLLVPPAGTMPVTPTRAATLAIGDVDGDGDVDIFAGTPSISSQDELLRNDGTGRFVRDLTALPARSRSGVFSSVMLDYDGDGDRDLILSIGLNTTGQLVAYANNGTGQFTVANNVFVGATPTSRITTYDANGDGNTDLLLEGSAYSSVTFLLHQGATYVASQPVGQLPSLANVRQLHLFDYEGDGDRDLGVDTGSGIRLLRNDGGFHFVELPADLVPPFAYTSIEGADLDGDGDADFLAFPSSNEIALLMGRRVQLHAPRLARLGMPYELHLRTAVSILGELRTGVFVVNVNPLLPALPLPGLGVLRVDPAGALLGFGLVPTGDDRSLPAGLRMTTLLPNAPALLGATLYAQALAVTTTATVLSNRVTDVIH